MIIPSGGRVVIVDDKIEEIGTLMTVLSKEGIGFTYFDGSIDSLPISPLQGTIFMFLDLELDKALTDDKSKASQDINVMKHILGANAFIKSVVLIVWSGAMSILRELKTLMSDEGVNPLVLIEINKADCKEDGEFILQKIDDQINQHLAEIPSFSLLTFWDNIVGQAAMEVYKNSIVCDSNILSDINIHIDSLYFELAKAQLGKDNVTKESSISVLNVFNMILANKISNTPITE